MTRTEIQNAELANLTQASNEAEQIAKFAWQDLAAKVHADGNAYHLVEQAKLAISRTEAAWEAISRERDYRRHIRDEAAEQKENQNDRETSRHG